MNETFVRAVEAATLSPNETLAAEVRGWPVMVARSDDNYFALLNRCSHAASELASGRVRRGLILCPLHGAPFRLDTGACAASAASYPAIRTFSTRVINGWVEVAVPDHQPAHDERPVPLA